MRDKHNVRLLEQDHAALKAVSKLNGVTMDSLIREAAMKELYLKSVRLSSTDKQAVVLNSDTYGFLTEYAGRNGITLQSAIHSIVERNFQ